MKYFAYGQISTPSTINSLDLNVPEPTYLEQISQPDKFYYEEGEEFDSTGLQLKLIFNDNKTYMNISNSDITFTPTVISSDTSRIQASYEFQNKTFTTEIPVMTVDILRPTLFPPSIVTSRNLISWSQGASNGDFGTVVGKIDNEVVTSPLTVTQELDGKTLVVECSEEAFNSSQSSIEIEYTSADVSTITVGNQVVSSGYGFICTVSNFSVFKNGVSSSGVLFTWDENAGTENYSGDTLTVKGVDDNYKIISVQYKSNCPRTICEYVSGGINNLNVTGSIKINNITRNNYVIVEFNNSYTSSFYMTGLGWENDDQISIEVNFN